MNKFIFFSTLILIIYSFYFHIDNLNEISNSFSELKKTNNDFEIEYKENLNKAYEYNQKKYQEVNNFYQQLSNHIFRLQYDPQPQQLTIAEDNELPNFEIWIDDNHMVYRNDKPAAALTWVIKYNNNTVLERNAKGETQYRYFGRDKGNYEIYLKSYYKGKYEKVSNSIFYQLN